MDFWRKKLLWGSRNIFTFFFSCSFLGFLEKICTCEECDIVQSERFIMAFRKKLPLNYANCLNQLDKYECEQNVKCCWKFIDMHVIIFIILIVSQRPVRAPGKYGFPVSILYSRIYLCFVVLLLLLSVNLTTKYIKSWKNKWV